MVELTYIRKKNAAEIKLKLNKSVIKIKRFDCNLIITVRTFLGTVFII